MPGDDHLSPHFRLSEFRCRCCGNVIERAARELAQRLEPVRLGYGPIRIVSGFRCARKNALSGGRLFSQHLVGLAADIACDTNQDRYRLVNALLVHGFLRIGIGDTFLHADISTATSPVIWTYYS